MCKNEIGCVFSVSHNKTVSFFGEALLPFFLETLVFRSKTLLVADVPKNRDGASRGPEDD
jgi:hypothetical protein